MLCQLCYKNFFGETIGYCFYCSFDCFFLNLRGQQASKILGKSGLGVAPYGKTPIIQGLYKRAK